MVKVVAKDPKALIKKHGKKTTRRSLVKKRTKHLKNDLISMLYINNKNYNITNFTIYGERHCGTKLLHDLINRNFQLPLTWKYGFKHWYGFCDNSILEQADNTLFIGIVRNPYDWIMAMKKIPYHLKINKYRSMEDLLFKEWCSFDDEDKEIIHDRNYITGNRYKNIFDMRSHKLNYLINYMPFLVNKYILIRYEDLILDMDNFILTISKFYRLHRYEKYLPRSYNNGYAIPKNILSIINDNLDWSVENKLGYYVFN